MARSFNKINGVDDLVLLEAVTEEAIVENLRVRFKRDLIYTYIGNVLLSVNPFRLIKGSVGPGVISSYTGRKLYELAPHVYALAEDTYRAMMSTHDNQCVLISGESGAGKTEAAKIFMSFITAVSGSAQDGDHLKEQLLQSNPVLEAFGNAKTVRNDNSSRFGKYMRLSFDFQGVPVGGDIQNYLLEKPRVVKPGQGERNFHIFYFLCTSNIGQELLNGGNPKDFAYLNNGADSTVRGLNDTKEFNIVEESVRQIGLANDTVQSMWELCAAILWLGNATFGGGSRKGAAKHSRTKSTSSLDAGASKDALENAAKLLGIDSAALAKALTHRTVKAGMETMVKPLDSNEAMYTRDAFSKALYSRNFNTLVAEINRNIRGEGNLEIGILDIYGFEIFENNSFEQLCINFCNEKLQQVFIQLTLKSEQDEYAAEGIEWTPVDFFNNKIVCDLIEKRNPAGILAYLDEESIYPNGSDDTLMKKFKKNLSKHKHFDVPNNKVRSSKTDCIFVIKHFAGEVSYNVEGFLEKNRDTLFRDLVEAAGSSSNQYVRDLFPEAAKAASKKRPPTAGSQFKVSMTNLVKALMACSPHYIRCIKPNDEKRSGTYNVKRVEHQVKYLGLLENVKVKRAGFSFRQTYPDFVRRYKMLGGDATWPTSERYDDKRDTTTILQAVGIAPDEFQYGRTKIFLRKPMTLFLLEEQRERKLHDIANIINSCYRAWKARKFFLDLKELSMSLFGGQKRRRGSIHLYFLGDYINCKKEKKIQTVLHKFNEKKILFADVVEKIDTKWRHEQRLLVCTEGALYNFDVKKMKLQRRMPLETVECVSLSTFADNYFVVKLTYPYDKRGDYLMKSLRKAEIVTALKNALDDKGKELKLVFNDTLEWKRKKNKSSKAIFIEDSSIKNNECVEQGNRKTAVLTIKVGVGMCSKAPLQLSSKMYGGSSFKSNSKLRTSNVGTKSATSITKRASGNTSKQQSETKTSFSSYKEKKKTAKKTAPPAIPSRKSAAPPPVPSRKEQVTAMFDYDANDSDELTIKEGDTLTVVTRKEPDAPDGWVKCKFRGKVGLVPENYVQKV